MCRTGKGSQEVGKQKWRSLAHGDGAVSHLQGPQRRMWQMGSHHGLAFTLCPVFPPAVYCCASFPTHAKRV